MVKVHGNWCGPDWTAGQRISAEGYALAGGDWSEPCIDAVDCACRAHDKGCSHKDGCSVQDDKKLLRAMAAYRGSIWNRIRHPIISSKADLMTAIITAAMLTRSR